MEFRSLQYFLAVAEEQNFTRAAARCHISQPSISQQIRALERELGEPLFERRKGRVTLTLSSAGVALLPHARACLAAVAAAKAEFSARAGQLVGTLTLGTVEGLERSPVPGILRDYGTRFPFVDIRLTSGTSGPLLALVADGSIDAAVIAKPAQGLPPAIASQILLSDQLMAVRGAEAPGAGDPVTLEELAKLALISYSPESGLRALLQDAMIAAGHPLHVSYATNDVAFQVALVKEGIGTAVSAGSDPALDDPDVLCSPIQPALRYEKALVWRRSAGEAPTLRALLQVWRAATSDASPR